MSLPSAKRLLLATRGTARPFAMSGAFSNSLDGWTFVGNGLSFDTTRFRSSPTSVNGLGSLERSFDGRDVAGLRITLSHWFRRTSGNGPLTMLYKIDDGALVEFARLGVSETEAAPNFKQFEGSFVNPGKRFNSLTLRFTMSNNDVRFDDWSITGTRP